MTTTIEIPDDVLHIVMCYTRAASANEAVLQVLQEYASKHDQRALIALLGTVDDHFYPPGELERMRSEG